MAPAKPNLHATAVVIGDRGVVITGASGSGKTTLAMALMAFAHSNGRFARLVSDDQILLHARNGRLIAESPHQIRGMIEVYGLGPRPCQAHPEAVVDLVVNLRERTHAPRFPEHATTTLAGIDVASLTLEHRNAQGAILAVLTALRS